MIGPFNTINGTIDLGVYLNQNGNMFESVCIIILIYLYVKYNMDTKPLNHDLDLMIFKYKRWNIHIFNDG